MDKREKELSELKSYTDEVDKDLTMILQTLQWDRQHLLQGKPLVKCKYDSGHRIPEEIKDRHELECFRKMHGYTEDAMLPEPLDTNANTVVKLSDKDITTIINIAATSDPSFRRGVGCQGPQPLTLERLQATYTVDERRAIHNAVVSKAPASQDLMDLTLPREDQEPSKGSKSRLEILSEMRDMKRRPVKYRVASKTRNYSDVLRGVIQTQMEMYTGVKSEPLSSIQDSRTFIPMNIKQEYIEEEHNYNNEPDTSIPNRDVQREPRYEPRHNTRETRTEERRHRKRESEERLDRHNHRRSEYSSSKYDSDRRRYKERERVRSRSKERRHTNETSRHKDRRRYEERSSRDRRTDDRHLEKRDKHRSNGSYSYADVKVKEEKLSRYYDGYNDYDN